MAVTNEIRQKWQYVMHGVHHEFPKDKGRLAMPPLLSVTVATVLLLIAKVTLGDFAFSFLPGFLTGYSAYLSVHYMVHASQPPKNYLKRLWINHGIHHYRNCGSAFGVSSPFWDYVYGTLERTTARGERHFHNHQGKPMMMESHV